MTWPLTFSSPPSPVDWYRAKVEVKGLRRTEGREYADVARGSYIISAESVDDGEWTGSSLISLIVKTASWATNTESSDYSEDATR